MLQLEVSLSTLPAFKTRSQDTKERGNHSRVFALLLRGTARASCSACVNDRRGGNKAKKRTRNVLLYASLFLLTTPRECVEDGVHACFIAPVLEWDTHGKRAYDEGDGGLGAWMGWVMVGPAEA